MTLYKWSQTAALDTTADPFINWQEGQAPSSINDSARAMMAATAKYRDDSAGAILTSGSATAYAISSNQVFDALTHLHGQMIAFVPHLTNGATLTLSVDGLGAKPLRSAPSAELPAGVLIAGTPYTCTYNHSDGAFYLRDFHVLPYSVPLGGGLPYFGLTTPNSAFAFPYGQSINRTTYQSLFNVIGTTYGSVDGSTFNLPDLRGRVLAGRDDMGGAAASRLTSSYFGASAAALGAVGGAESHTLATGEMPSHTHANTLNDPGHKHKVVAYGGSGGTLNNGTSSVDPISPQIDTTTVPTGITITNAAAGGGAAHKIVQPTIICNYILRII